jgi:DNA-binding GntR family transcriptional regulator
MAMDKVSTSPRATLSERAYQAIKRDILRGEIEEGTFLSEKEVRRRHKIGRTPFREACNRLHNEGLVQVMPRRGCFVPEMSFRDIREIFEARLLLEGLIAEIAARRATATQIEEMAHLVTQPLPPGDPEDRYEGLVQANKVFHVCLARMTQNRELVRLVTSTLERSERLAYLELRSAVYRSKDVQMLHRPIVNGIRRRNPVATRQAVIRDIRNGQTDIFGRDEL